MTAAPGSTILRLLAGATLFKWHDGHQSYFGEVIDVADDTVAVLCDDDVLRCYRITDIVCPGMEIHATKEAWAEYQTDHDIFVVKFSDLWPPIR